MSEGHTTPVIKEEGEFRTPLFRTPEQERDRKGRFTKSVLDMNEARQSTLDAIDQCVDVDASDDEQAEAAALKSGISKTWEKKVRLETLKNEEATREFEQQQVALENENNKKMAMQSANSSYVQSTLFEAIALCKDGYLMELSSDDRLFLMGKAHDVFDANDLVVALLKHHGSNTAVKVDNPNSHSSDDLAHGQIGPIAPPITHGGPYLNVENIEKIPNLKMHFLDVDFQRWKQLIKRSRTNLPAGAFMENELTNFVLLKILEENRNFQKDDVVNSTLKFLEPYLLSLTRDLPSGPAARTRISNIPACGPTVKNLQEFISSIQLALEQSLEEIPIKDVWKKLVSKLRNTPSKCGEDRLNWIDDRKDTLILKNAFNVKNITDHILLISARYTYELDAQKVMQSIDPVVTAPNKNSGKKPGKEGAKPQQAKKENKPTDVCWNCGALGHHTWNCSKLNQETKVPQAGYPNKEGKAAKEAVLNNIKNKKTPGVGAVNAPDVKNAETFLPLVGCISKSNDFTDTILSLKRQARGEFTSSGYSKPQKPIKDFTERTRIEGKNIDVGLDTKAHEGNWICPKAVKELGLRVLPADPKMYGSPLGGTFESKNMVKIRIKFLRFNYAIEIEARIFPKGSTVEDPILLGQTDIKRFDLMTYHLLADANELQRLPEDLDHIMQEINNRLIGENDLWRISNSKLSLEAALVAQLSCLDPNSNEYSTYIDMIADDMISIDFPDEKRDELKQVLIWAIEKNVITDKLDGSTMNAPPFSVPFRPGESFEGVPPRQYSLAKTEVIRAWLEKLLSMNIIQKSSSKTTSPVHVVQQDGKYRVTIDDRLLNEKLIRAHGSIPELKKVIEQLGSHDFYGSFDLLLAYYQVSAAPEMRKLFAFSTPFGNFEFQNTIPMGEKNIPAHFSACMRDILEDLPACFPTYFDDVFTYGDSADDFIVNVKQLFVRFHEKNVKISSSKVHVGSKDIKALGYTINKDGYKVKQETVNKLTKMDFPTAENLKNYLGLVNVFSGFVKNLPELTAPFKEVRKKGAIWIVTDEMKAAHLKIKEAISQIPRLHFLDPDKEIFMECDASDYGVGSILYQLNDNGDKDMVRIFCSTFNEGAMKWTTIQKESYAIVKSVMAYESLIDGREVTVKTDHRNLLWMSKIQNPMISRWYEYLFLFNLNVIHIPGDKNVYADALSRLHMNIKSIPPNTISTLSVLDIEHELDAEEEKDKEFEELFNSIHNAINGHFGVDYTIENLLAAGADKKNLRQKVIKLISECATCVKSRGKLSKLLKERHSITASAPFNIIEMDFLQSLPITDSGNEHLLVLIDSFTRFVYLHPCPDTTAESAKDALLHVYAYFGTPTHLRSDNAQAFLSEGFQKFREAIETSHNTTVPRHPQSHGQVEVANSQVTRHLRNILHDVASADNKNWDKVAPIVANILNNKIHSATGYSPFNLMYGSQHTLRHSSNDLNGIDTSDADNYLRNLNKALATARNYAAASQDFLTISNYDKAPATPSSFKVGDYVMYPNPRTGDKLKKAAMKMVGPYLIESTTDSKDVFRIKDTVQDKFVFAHANSFIKFNKTLTPTEALDIAAKDYGEYRFTVLDHVGNPKDRSSIYVKVNWQDDNQTSWISLATCKDVDVVRNYFKDVKDFKDVCRLPDLQPKSTVRHRKQSEKLGAQFDNN